MKGRLLLVLAGATVGTGAYAGYINPYLLSRSPDGTNDSFDYILQSQTAWAGYSTGTYDASTQQATGDYGDQSDAAYFAAANGYSGNVVVHYAGYEASAAVGWYSESDATAIAADEAAGNYTAAESYITWVVGNYNGTYQNTGTIAAKGDFGLAFESGDVSGVLQGTVYYSDSSLNTIDGGGDHLALVAGKSGSALAGSYFMGWEDEPLYASDQDYNDLVMTMTGAQSPASTTPEPFTMALAGSALGLALIRRRRAK
jgi:hypothetical protein